ncbi:MAG: alanine racemase [Cellulomonadaceae bacterium]|nr:alanine racemase [Cellulomonadaceae bacterium]
MTSDALHPDASWAAFPARAIVNLDAIEHNARALRDACTAPHMMAVIKADAYGHGIIPVSRAALRGGADWLGAAQASEALELREAGITVDQARILTWLHGPGVPFSELIIHDIDVSVAAYWVLDGLAEAAATLKQPARIHLKIDTGLGRNGIMPEDLPEFAARVAELQKEGLVHLVGVWTHLALADEPGNPTIAKQKDVFDDAVAVVEAAGTPVEIRHLANSAALLTAPDMHYELTRPGIALYGFSPVPQVQPPSAFGLVPAMTLEAELATVKHVHKGQGVSYAHLYITTEDTILGLVPLGYADGIPRHASGGSAGVGGPIAVGDRVLRVAGRVCMDQVVLDLGPDAQERPGDVVTLFGPTDGLAYGASVPNAEDWAAAAGSISYEIVTRLGARVPRMYVGGPSDE